MDTQELIALLIVLVAVLFLVKRGKKKGCSGCSSKGCGSTSVQITPCEEAPKAARDSKP
jgi:FeoB-associated Cys-rich membrane protein